MRRAIILLTMCFNIPREMDGSVDKGLHLGDNSPNDRLTNCHLKNRYSAGFAAGHSSRIHTPQRHPFSSKHDDYRHYMAFDIPIRKSDGATVFIDRSDGIAACVPLLIHFISDTRKRHM